MGLQDYFARHRYSAKYQIGDRIRGTWNNIPFTGSVGNDTVISDIDGPRISVHLDLPIKHGDKFFTMIIVKHVDVEPLK